MNRRFAHICAVIVIILSAGALMATINAPRHKYVGAARCSFCHSSSEMGDQYGIWLVSKHGAALFALTSEKAKEYKKQKGVEDPLKDERCLKCHLTGYNAPFELLGPLYRKEDGVSCEGCHGAGGGYSFFSIMKDRSLAIGKGLVKSPEETCVACHTEEGHEIPPFDMKESMKKIEHLKPEKP